MINKKFNYKILTVFGLINRIRMASVFPMFQYAAIAGFLPSWPVMLSCRSRGVAVSTQDSESCDGSSNLPGTFRFLPFCKMISRRRFLQIFQFLQEIIKFTIQLRLSDYVIINLSGFLNWFSVFFRKTCGLQSKSQLIEIYCSFTCFIFALVEAPV